MNITQLLLKTEENRSASVEKAVPVAPRLSKRRTSRRISPQGLRFERRNRPWQKTLQRTSLLWSTKRRWRPKMRMSLSIGSWWARKFSRQMRSQWLCFWRAHSLPTALRRRTKSWCSCWTASCGLCCWILICHWKGTGRGDKVKLLENFGCPMVKNRSGRRVRGKFVTGTGKSLNSAALVLFGKACQRALTGDGREECVVLEPIVAACSRLLESRCDPVLLKQCCASFGPPSYVARFPSLCLACLRHRAQCY